MLLETDLQILSLTANTIQNCAVVCLHRPVALDQQAGLESVSKMTISRRKRGSGQRQREVFGPGINPQLPDSTGKCKAIPPRDSTLCPHWICFHKFLYHFLLVKQNSSSVSDSVFPSTHILLPPRLLNTSFL